MRVYCPAGCDSTTFQARRLGVILQEFTVDEDGAIEPEPAMAEAGGALYLTCSECGRAWKSRRDLQLAYYLEAQYA
jgi:hypothetical protein